MSGAIKRVFALPLLIGLGVALFNFTAIRLKDYRVGDLGLGIATSTKVEQFKGYQINQIEGGTDEVIPAIKGFTDSGKAICLMLGNSQLHAINYQKTTDHLTVFHVNRLAEENKLKMAAIQLSSPNINFQELLLYYLTLRKQGIRLSWLTIGCTYRTFQLTSLREKFKDQLRLLENDLDTLKLNSEIKRFYKEQTELVKTDNAPAERGTWQEIVEDYLTHGMEISWEGYRYRGNVRSKLKVLPGMLYRSSVATKSFYEGSETTEALNMLFLEQLIQLCGEDNVKILLYQPPHPQSTEPFQYDLHRYKAAFSRLQELDIKNDHVFFESYEQVVPLPLWGKNNSGRLDVFHFKGEGHQILAGKIFDFLESRISNDSYVIQ